MEDLLKILEILAWPLTVLVALAALRGPIVSLARLVESVDAPGGVTFHINQEKVQRIIEEGRATNAPAEQLAKEIVEAVEITDVSELRILRALFDEPRGRLIANYEK